MENVSPSSAGTRSSYDDGNEEKHGLSQMKHSGSFGSGSNTGDTTDAPTLAEPNTDNDLPKQRTPTKTIPAGIEQKLIMSPQLLSLTVHKDSTGYGMKVSGDNPVFVESVKANGPALRAGLIAGDMILKVNGTPVRNSIHTHVVQLIKSHTIVELMIQRSQKMQSNPLVSVGGGGINSSNAMTQRDRITGPQPVDNEKRREMEFSKIKTLQLMLEQEKINLQNLMSDHSNNNRQDRARAEATINKLQEQLRQVGGEDPTLHFLTPSQALVNPLNFNVPTTTITTTHQTQPHSSPAFLSRFPRSLSSLSLGARRKSDKEVISPPNNVTNHGANPFLGGTTGQQQNSMQHRNQQLPLPILDSNKRNIKDGTPPPLPQRNQPRKSVTPEDGTPPFEIRPNTLVSDLDYLMPTNPSNPKTSYTPAPAVPSGSNSGKISGKKRTKTKTKALSEPKMGMHMFLQMETQSEGNDNTDHMSPPPLPPRQSSMMDESQSNNNNNNNINCKIPGSEDKVRNASITGDNPVENVGRHQPNSVDTLMTYPLIATCTPVRDNVNDNTQASSSSSIVQQLYRHQQNLLDINEDMPTHSCSSACDHSNFGATSPTHSKKHRRTGSATDNVQSRDRYSKTSSDAWELLDRDSKETPPGTPPPPYLSPHIAHSETVFVEEFENLLTGQVTVIENSAEPAIPNQIVSAQTYSLQKGIISMEDEDVSDQEYTVDEHGPFNHIQSLLEPENAAHLAVFLNYILSNSDPAPILFYLITGLYKEGTVKDMRKWAYEIHSTFLVPCAPLLWFNVDESLAREVDNVLQNEYDKVEILRKVFWKSRKKAKEKICDQLRDFQQKRTAGLGTMYGPTDQQLTEAKGDKAKEQKIFEETLLPKLLQLLDEVKGMEETSPKYATISALCSALSTVLHRIFITRSNPGSPLDKVQHFVSREKSLKSRIIGKSRKTVERGHHLILHQYYEVTHCNHCQNIIWGVSPQGYQCADCKLNIHRTCSKALEENCPGPVPQKRKETHTDNKISKFMGKIRPAHHFIPNERRRTDEETDDFVTNDRSQTTSMIPHPSDGRLDSTNTSICSDGGPHSTGDIVSSQIVGSDMSAADRDSKANRSKSKSAPVSVNRSESYKERLSQKRSRNNRRKTSDPSLTKTSNDEKTEIDLLNVSFTASSSSSLSSSSLDSRSTSLEHVVGSIANTLNANLTNTSAGLTITPRKWVDSEDDADLAEIDWSSNIASDLLETLSQNEKKRQEIINEIYQTERNHVRTLRLLEGMFMRPLQESGALSYEHLQLLFPSALLSLKDRHNSFEQKLKQRRIEHGYLVRSIGDLLLEMFEGDSGKEIQDYAIKFCARQQTALEALKEKRRKDENLQRLLNKAESHKACRRLQLKDLLPTVLQRLTKYPLLFQNLSEKTKLVLPDDEAENYAITQALESSKRILVYVNQAVKTVEDSIKLQTIQRKLDKSNLERDNEFRHIDLTQYKLIYDGPLTMRKNPGTPLYGLLFENMLVLLHKQDDKYFLRNFQHVGAGNGETKTISPIINFVEQETIIRIIPFDIQSLYLIITKAVVMMELTFQSNAECKTWIKHMASAANNYKNRSKPVQEVIEDTPSANLLFSNTKEFLDTALEPSANISTSESIPNLSTSAPTQDTTNLRSNSVNNEKTAIATSKNENVRSKKPGRTESMKNISRTKKEIDDINENIDEVRSRCQSIDRNESLLCSRSSLNIIPKNEQYIKSSPAEPTTPEIPLIEASARLKILDNIIRESLAEKQKIICNLFRVPDEHFNEIVDIAGQPDTPKDSSDIALAAFAHVQALTEILNDYMNIIEKQQELSTYCDQCCHRSLRLKKVLLSKRTLSTTSTIRSESFRNMKKSDKETIQDDGYCQIDELRLPSVKSAFKTSQSAESTLSNTLSLPQQQQQQTPPLKSSAGGEGGGGDIKQISSNEEFSTHETCISDAKICEKLLNEEKRLADFLSCDHPKSRKMQSSLLIMDEKSADKKSDIRVSQLTEIHEKDMTRKSDKFPFIPSVPCHVIAGFITDLGSQLSQLLPKINDRENDREKLLRENQQLRELLNERRQEKYEPPEKSKNSDTCH